MYYLLPLISLDKGLSFNHVCSDCYDILMSFSINNAIFKYSWRWLRFTVFEISENKSMYILKNSDLTVKSGSL